MRIIAWSNLAAFAEKHPETAAPLKRWRALVKAGSWKTMSVLALAFGKAAHSVGGDRVRFEVAAGNYRMIVAFDFMRQIAFVKFIGTHDEYNAVNAARISQF